MIIIGIDPGVNGGIVVLGERGDVKSAIVMPETPRDLYEHLSHQVSLGDIKQPRAFAFMEKVMPFSRPGAKIGAKSSFTSGRGYGFLIMALIATGCAFDEVHAARWQKSMACLTHGDKNISKARAQQLFPNLKITHALADALLIAEYGRRIRTGQIETEPKTLGSLF